MTWKTTQKAAAVLGLVAQAYARITPDGLWDGNDWYNDDAKIGVRKGEPYSDDSATERRITSPVALDGDVLNYRDFDNVKRVLRLFPEEDYDFVVPERNDLYEYEGLLRAIGKFPAFCGESNLSGYTLDETCKRELATLFAHFNQETGQHDKNSSLAEWRQGLWHITEWVCTEPQWGAGTASCDYKQSWGWAADAYPPQPNVQYYGRGPFQLSWNYNYGAFSEVLVESTYNSRMYLLENPDQVHQDAYTVFTSALWFYMTPQSPKPSIHDVATGFMVPTAADTAAGFGPNFGVTTNIINGGLECGGGFENIKSQSRIDYYKNFLQFFELPEEDQSTLTCGNLASGFPTGGYGDAMAYFDQGWSGQAQCNPVKWQTPYSIYTRDDYKRCICDHFGEGEADCPQAEGNEEEEEESEQEEQEEEEEEQEEEDDNDGNDNDEDDEEEGGDEEEITLPEVDDPEQAFEEIWDNPHYSAEDHSRTMYQVDRSLDFIEKKLIEMHAIFEAHQLI